MPAVGEDLEPRVGKLLLHHKTVIRRDHEVILTLRNKDGDINLVQAIIVALAPELRVGPTRERPGLVLQTRAAVGVALRDPGGARLARRGLAAPLDPGEPLGARPARRVRVVKEELLHVLQRGVRPGGVGVDGLLLFLRVPLEVLARAGRGPGNDEPAHQPTLRCVEVYQRRDEAAHAEAQNVDLGYLERGQKV